MKPVQCHSSTQNQSLNAQDCEITFHDAGQFYYGHAHAWLAKKRMHTSGIGMPIPHWRVIDIDTDEDWNYAELLYSALRKRTTQDVLESVADS